MLSILLLLQTRGTVRAAELAERLEVSVRTIYRDVEALSSSGVPVYAERGRRGGIALLPGYRTNVTGLTHDEARSLFVLANHSAHTDLGLGGAFPSALRKVMAALPEPHRPVARLTSERILIDPSRWYGAEERPEHLGALQNAIFADVRLLLSYQHADRPGVHEYTVDPYGLVAKAGTWYLVADDRRVPRLYRVSRVLSATALDAPVRRRPAELAELWGLLRDQVEKRPDQVLVRVRVNAARLGVFCRIFAGQVIARPPEPTDGRTEATLRLGSVEEARRLLPLGPDVEVLSPDEVRADLAVLARAIADVYS